MKSRLVIQIEDGRYFLGWRKSRFHVGKKEAVFTENPQRYYENEDEAKEDFDLLNYHSRGGNHKRRPILRRIGFVMSDYTFRSLLSYVNSKGYHFANGDIFFNVLFLSNQNRSLFIEFCDACFSSWDELLIDENFSRVFKPLNIRKKRK